MTESSSKVSYFTRSDVGSLVFTAPMAPIIVADLVVRRIGAPSFFTLRRSISCSSVVRHVTVPLYLCSATAATVPLLILASANALHGVILNIL